MQIIETSGLGQLITDIEQFLNKARKDGKRFLSKIREDENGCWNWTGACSRDGYGRFKVAGKCVSTHRWAYAQYVGVIPEGMELDHLCRNRCCSNPAHLEAVSKAVNLSRRIFH